MSRMLKLLFASSLAIPALAFCGGHTYLDTRAEGEVPVSTFGYIGTQGPVLWAQLNQTANALCSNGTRQSPINLTPNGTTYVNGTHVHLQLPAVPKGAVFENLGSTVEVVMTGLGSSLALDGTSYNMTQFHFHHPAEHLDNNVSLPLEMHMVFAGSSQEMAVVGIHVDLVDSPGFELLETVFSSIYNIPTPGSTTVTKELHFHEMHEILDAGEFRRYTGSLTTPPCTEGVKWLVSTQKLSLSRQTFEAAQDIIGFNARFPQNNPGEPNLLSLVHT
ncbi:alpha carbonic anhydrase [Xylariomycetidae sp. FL0641]|nr:alpha carbonic anhydrase [Xylariomycetidae sp. FL0641]